MTIWRACRGAAHIKGFFHNGEKVYRDLSRFNIRVALEADGWHVDYTLKDERTRGGGPHYVIDALTGGILSKRDER